MGRWLPAMLFGLGACGFQSTLATSPGGEPDAAVPDGAPGGGDGPPGGGDGAPGDVNDIDDVVNVRTADEFLGTGDLEITALTATIDTDAMTVSTGLPAGVTFLPAPQDGGGPELAILHVRHFETHATLTVIGTRPLVILARDLVFSGTMHGEGLGAAAGPGAVASGPAVGGAGASRGLDDSGGGGGGGAGTAGAAGGASARLAGGGGGVATREGTKLAGGAAGGRAFAAGAGCLGEPGGGGGAIEIYARTQLVNSGNIDVGGGGGGGGKLCLAPLDGFAGQGGGGGGEIVLQAPIVTNSGRLSANGGGGGAGAGVLGDGGNGEDGPQARIPESAAARGGAPRGLQSAAGGDGASSEAGARPGGSDASNAGGGGGGGGRIVLLYRTRVDPGITSPTAETDTY